MSSASRPASIPALVAQAREVAAATRASSGGALRSAVAVLLVDTALCLQQGRDHPTTARLSAYLDAWPAGVGPVRPLSRGQVSLDLGQAVLMDVVASHVDEHDSVHPASGTLPGATLVPAALLVGERVGASGPSVAAAVAAGCEALVQAALQAGGARLYQESWWPASAFAALGSAVVTAVLLDLDDATTAHALGLAAASTGGLLSEDLLADGHYVLHGEATSRGVRAAFQAGAGMRSSWSLLDGPLDRALGVTLDGTTGAAKHHVLTCVTKEFACATPLQAVVRALGRLTPAVLDDLDEVEIMVPRPMLSFLTADTVVDGPPEAAASAAYAVAAAVAGRGADPAFFRSCDPGLAGRVTVKVGASPDVARDRSVADGHVVTLSVRTRTGTPTELVEPVRAPQSDFDVLHTKLRQAPEFHADAARSFLGVPTGEADVSQAMDRVRARGPLPARAPLPGRPS